MREYQERFEELRPLMLRKDLILPESYFISNFINGVKDEIKPMLKMLKPPLLLEAFEIANRQEQSLTIFGKLKNRTGLDIFYSKSNAGMVTRAKGFKNKAKPYQGLQKEVTGTKEERRITPQEIQYM